MIDTMIGLPFKAGGRGPVYYDCYGLVRLFYEKCYEITLPTHTGYSETLTERSSAMIAANLCEWVEVADPQYGDVILFNIDGRPNHIGIYLDRDTMLHTSRSKDSCIEKFKRSYWLNKIEGYYRYGDISLQTPST